MNVIAHLFEYRVVPGHDAELAGYVRHSVLAGPMPAGLVSRCIGRRLSPGGPEHVALTVWEDPHACAQGTDGRGVPRYLLPKAGLLLDWSSRRYRITVSIDRGSENARILRVYCATVAPEEVERWERRAMDAAGAVAARYGILAVQVGVGIDAPGRAGGAAIVALTAWRDWDSVIAATGGHLDRLLLDTELADLERPAGADHYELLEPEPTPSARKAT